MSTIEKILALLQELYGMLKKRAPESQFQDARWNKKTADGSSFAQTGIIGYRAIPTNMSHHKLYWWLNVTAGSGVPEAWIHLLKDGVILASLPAGLVNTSAGISVSLFPSTANTLAALREVIGISGNGLSATQYIYPRSVVMEMDAIQIEVRTLNGATEYQAYFAVDSATEPF